MLILIKLLIVVNEEREGTNNEFQFGLWKVNFLHTHTHKKNSIY